MSQARKRRGTASLIITTNIHEVVNPTLWAPNQILLFPRHNAQNSIPVVFKKLKSIWSAKPCPWPWLAFLPHVVCKLLVLGKRFLAISLTRSSRTSSSLDDFSSLVETASHVAPLIDVPSVVMGCHAFLRPEMKTILSQTRTALSDGCSSIPSRTESLNRLA